MKINRIDDGEYELTHGDSKIRVIRGASRKWTVQAVEGIDFEDKNVNSYAEGKKVAEKAILDRRLTGRGSSAATPRLRRGPDVLAAIEDVEARLASIKRALAK